MTADQILRAIPSTEECTFNEFLRALGDAPERGDTQGWAELFEELSALEQLGMVAIERCAGRIDTLILTDAGVGYVRDLLRGAKR